MNEADLQKTAALLQRQWGLPVQAEPSWERLRKALHTRIQELLEEDFAGLVNAMYRLDVAEQHFKDALAAGTSYEISLALAEIVLERELRRIATRQKYRNHEQTDD